MIDKKIYTLTKEHKDQLKSWADKWIANTMSTKPMDDFDKKKMIEAVHGVRVPQYIIERPDLITIEDIENENNLEVKRVMIDRYGSDRYMQDSGAQLVQSDRYGELYVKPIEGDETMTMVKVINSTPEPDGTNKIYWLRVPPNTPTAHAGVAWSFGLDVDQYNPMKET